MNRIINFSYGEPKHDTAFYYKDSRFDAKNDLILKKKIVHHIL